MYCDLPATKSAPSPESIIYVVSVDACFAALADGTCSSGLMLCLCILCRSFILTNQSICLAAQRARRIEEDVKREDVKRIVAGMPVQRAESAERFARILAPSLRPIRSHRG